jgi:hypothetical protein
VTEGSSVNQGIVERTELLAGVYLAESLVRVNNGYVITSVLNTNEHDVEIPPSLEVEVVVLENDDRKEIARVGLAEKRDSRG